MTAEKRERNFSYVLSGILKKVMIPLAVMALAVCLAQSAGAVLNDSGVVSVADWEQTGVIMKTPAGNCSYDRSGTDYTQDDLWCLAAIIYQEAGGDLCSDLCRELVGSVVLNRVEDKSYFGKTNTIRDVLQAKGQYGMEDGVKWTNRGNSAIEQAAIKRAYAAAQSVLEGSRPCPKNVFFQSEFDFLGDGTYMELDGFYFNYIGT